MIIFVRSIMIRDGKQKEAWEWAGKVTAYLNENYADYGATELLRNLNGPANQVHWTVRLESLAALEEVMAKVAVDSDYQEMVAELSDLFVDSTNVVNLYRTVD